MLHIANFCHCAPRWWRRNRVIRFLKKMGKQAGIETRCFYLALTGTALITETCDSFRGICMLARQSKSESVQKSSLWSHAVRNESNDVKHSRLVPPNWQHSQTWIHIFMISHARGFWGVGGVGNVFDLWWCGGRNMCYISLYLCIVQSNLNSCSYSNRSISWVMQRDKLN